MPSPTAGPIDRDLAGVGKEVVLGILGGDAHLDRDAADLDRLLVGDADLGVRQLVALRDADLRLHQVAAGDHLGDRVLDLDARVDLDEVVAAVLADQKLDGAGVGVVRVARDLERVLGQPRAQRDRQRPGRRVLDDLLVAALHAAVALEQVHQVAVAVAQHLHLDVLGTHHQLLEEDRVVAERLLRLGARAVERLAHLGRRAHHAHAAAAAAGGRLDQHRVADLVGEGARRLERAQRLGRARYHRNAGGLGNLARRDLVAERVDRLGRRADEDDARVATLARKRRALGQQAVAGVDRVDLVALGQLDDLVLGQIGRDRLQPPADQVRLVGLVAVQVDAVFLGEDRDRAEPELGRRAEHADRDLAAVGTEKPLERDDAHEPRDKYHFIEVPPSPN